MTSWSDLTDAEHGALNVICLGDEAPAPRLVNGAAVSALIGRGLVEAGPDSITPTPEGLRVWKERE